jgi:hypothetical protein
MIRMTRAAGSVLAAAGVLALSLPAGAATVVLDGQGVTSQTVITPEILEVVEEGFSYQTSRMFWDGRGIVLEDDFGPIISHVRLEREVPFDVLFAEVIAYTKAWISGPASDHETSEDWERFTRAEKYYWDNLRFIGYRNAQAVAALTIAVGGPTELPADPVAVAFDESFRHLDELIVEFLLPEDYFRGFSGGHPNLPPETIWCADWCGGINVSRLEVAPVPVPPAAGLLLGAVGALVLAGWRKRTSGSASPS